MNGLDLFSGIGGISLALKPWVRTLAYCERDIYAQGVLLSRMRDGTLERAPIWDDVRTLRAEHFAPGSIDIIYGGFPCQDISECRDGRGLGGERSGLFWEIMRLAEEIQPKFLFLENVRNIRSKGLGVVARALADCGYDCRWDIFPAYTDRSFFEGERWFCLAKATRIRREARGPSCRNESAKSVHHGTLPIPLWNSSAGELARVDDGLPLWSHRIRCLGNAVVPHQAREAFVNLSGIGA